MGTQKRHVLLVDDNPNDLELALEVLLQNEDNADVVTARGGPEAIAYLETHRGQCQRPSLILLDLNMPQLDGLGVLDARANGDPSIQLSTFSACSCAQRHGVG